LAEVDLKEWESQEIARCKGKAGISLTITAANGLSAAFPHPAAREIVCPAGRWPRQWLVGARPAGGQGRLWGAKSERGGLAGCVRRLGRHALPGGAAASAIY
jgi:hypothetical protein